MRYYELLRAVRERLAVSTRDVERQSRKIADQLGDQEYYISDSCMLRIESGHAPLTLHKLYSLSEIYRIRVTTLMRLCGVGVKGEQAAGPEQEAAFLDQFVKTPHGSERKRSKSKQAGVS
ncbi:MAG: hypothetical protein H0U18_05320 [Pyrinomonadaceae bacterium]|nr:hypothetical protein [Pyrinomonadaceae bacterium]